MSLLREVARFFGVNLHDPEPAQTPAYSKRTLTLVQEGVNVDVPVAAEVDNEKERYTAKRYIAHLKDCENGDRRNFPEWQRYLLPMMIERPKEYDAFIDQVGALMEQGEWLPVLTPEQQEEKRRNILARRDEILAESLRPMNEAGSMGGVHDEEEAAGTVSAQERDAVIANVLAEAQLEPWPELSDEDGEDDEEDESEAGVEERTEDGEEGQAVEDEDDGACKGEER